MAAASQKRTSGKASARTTQRRTAQKNTGRKNTGGAGNRGTTRKKTSGKSAEDSFVGKEIAILAFFAVCLLLFLSNAGVCGAVGESVHQVLVGVFGLLGYVFPIYLFAAVLFYYSNRDNSKAMAKLAVSAGLFVVLGGLIALVTTGDFDPAVTVGQYYQNSVEELGGGAIGGIFLKLLCPYIGKIGAYVVAIVLVTIGIVFITEKSVLKPIEKGSRRVYDSAREDAARRREIHAARAEERRKYRLEKKVSGVAFDTKLGDDEADEEEEAEPVIRVDASSKSAAEEKTEPVRITGLGYSQEKTQGPDEEEEEAYGEEEQESPIIPISGDTLRAKKDTRTLAELEALDSLHENIFSSQSGFVGWGERADWEDAEPQQKEKSNADISSDIDSDIDIDADMDADMDTNASPLHLHEISRRTGGTETRQETEPLQADTRRVVTASGKVMEVDIDPDDDPLTRKRRENAAASRPAAGQIGQTGQVGQISQTGQTASSPAASPSAVVQKKQPPKPYVRPPYKLLKAGDRNQRRSSDKELRETARKLETTLHNFGVGVTVTNISCGPTVTRYELQPEQGVRVSKIVGLSDDIKLNLAAADIRIEAPIPGKASVGIEVPNKSKATVYLRDVLESEAFRRHPSKLAFAVGQDISGEIIVTDLAKMPHLLIAGATGSGKSVCINTLIMSVLYKAKPEEVRLIMVDPKVVELSVYNGIPHLLIPVVTDPKKAAGALNWAVAEMTDRYRKFADWNVRDLKGYNAKVREEAKENGEEAETLPQIVIIVDELSDLMMVCPGDVEDAICRLAQMARAAGIHLVLATQRPSVNVITGLIKANVPSRIAFSVSSGVDSRTIIDMNGAEKLLGSGDMLFYPSGYQKPVRIQGAFVSDSEVAAVVDFVTEHNQSQAYDSAVEARLAAAGNETGHAPGGESGRDEYFAEAGRFIIEKQKASIGMLQRMFKIGFNRAARIMDQLADAGVVSAEAGTKAREILMDMNQYEQLLQSLGL